MVLATAVCGAPLIGQAQEARRPASRPAAAPRVKPAIAKFRRRLPVATTRGFDVAMKAFERPAPVRVRVGPGDSLADAIARLSNGGTIEIAGLVRANVVIDGAGNSYKLVGITSNAALVGLASDKPVLDIRAARAVHVSKLSIRGGSAGIRARGDTYLRLRDLRIRDSGTGIDVRSPAGKLVQLTSSVVSNNRRTGVAAAGATLFIASSTLAGNGMNLSADRPRAVYLHDAHVLNAPSSRSGSGRRSAATGGAMVRGGATVVVEGSRFSGNGGFGGLILEGVRSADIRATRFQRNMGPGLVVRDSNSVVVKKSEFTGNVGFNVRFTKGSIKLVDSQLSAARKDSAGDYGFGFVATDGGTLQFVRAKFLNNAEAGIRIQRESCSDITSPCKATFANCEIGHSPFGVTGHTCGGDLTQIRFHDIEKHAYLAGSETCGAPPPRLPRQ